MLVGVRLKKVTSTNYYYFLKMDTYGTFCEGSPSEEAWMWIADILISFFFLVTVYFRVEPGNSRENLSSCQQNQNAFRRDKSQFY